MRTVPRLARTLRGRCRSERKFASLNQNEIADVNERVRQISKDADRIAPKHKVKTHDDTAGDAPAPKRHRNDAFALSFRRDPLDDETHRKNEIRDHAENDERATVETEKAMLVAEPGDGENHERVHKRLNNSAICPHVVVMLLLRARTKVRKIGRASCRERV